MIKTHDRVKDDLKTLIDGLDEASKKNLLLEDKVTLKRARDLLRDCAQKARSVVFEIEDAEKLLRKGE